MITQPPKDKSVGAALVLTFLFGPIGLFYIGVWPGLIGLFILAPIATVGVFLFGIPTFIVWMIAMVWAAVSAGHSRSAFQLYLARR